MDSFNDREKAFEAKFHVDEELAFKVTARRDKLLGRWVAGHCGLSGQAAESYALSVVQMHLSDFRQETMVTKLLADLSRANAAVGAAELHAELDRLVVLARQQVETEFVSGRLTVTPAESWIDRGLQ